MTSRYCPFCAASAAIDWKFCQACGRQLPAAAKVGSRNHHLADLWQRALRHMETKDYDDAERVAGLLLDAGCDAGDQTALLGSIALRRAKIDVALELLDRALEQSPGSPFVRIKRAEYWRMIGITPKAIDELIEGLRRAEDESVRQDLRQTLEKLKRESRWNFSRASPFGKQ